MKLLTINPAGEPIVATLFENGDCPPLPVVEYRRDNDTDNLVARRGSGDTDSTLHCWTRKNEDLWVYQGEKNPDHTETQGIGEIESGARYQVRVAALAADGNSRSDFAYGEFTAE